MPTAALRAQRSIAALADTVAQAGDLDQARELFAIAQRLRRETATTALIRRRVVHAPALPPVEPT